MDRPEPLFAAAPRPTPMHPDDENRHARGSPTPDAFKEAVASEDPSGWGAARVDARPASVVAPTARAAPAARAQPPVGAPRFSLGATFLGWAVAAFFTLVLSAVTLALTGVGQAQDGRVDLSGLAVTGLIAYLVAAFLAYLVGGYAAGRISLWNGVWHGLGTVAWAVVFAALAIVASVYAAGLVDLGVTIDLASLRGTGLLAALLSLVAMMAGAALGGRLGERYHELKGAHARREHARSHRGRPL